MANNEPQIPKFKITSSDVPFDNDKVIQMVNDNIKTSPEDNVGVEYNPKQENVDKEKLKDILARAYLYIKNNWLKVIPWIIAGTVAISGAVYGGTVLAEEVEEKKNEEVAKYVSAILVKHTEGRERKHYQEAEYYEGDHNFWYDPDKMVDLIINERSYEDAERLYLQFGRIYNGLKNEGNIEKMKIPSLYKRLREKLLKDNINIGPEEFDDWLKSIGKYYVDKDNQEEMYQYYLAWFYETREEVEEDKGDKEIRIGDKIFIINDDYEVVDTSGIKR